MRRKIMWLVAFGIIIWLSTAPLPAPEGFELLGLAELTESVSWTLPTLVSTTLYARDQKHIMALDLAQAAN